MKKQIKQATVYGLVTLLGMSSLNLFTRSDGLTNMSQTKAAEVGQNGTMMQYFEWYLPNDGQLWNKMNRESQKLSNVGITALWIPPAYKGSGQNDVGYGVYDMYDLGEFDQKGTVRTKYGTKAELKAAINNAHANGISVYGDTVMNHRMGADGVEQAPAVEVNGSNRDQVISGNYNIGAWTSFTFPGRQTDPGKTSKFQWKWWHFNGVDYNNNNGQSKVFRFDSAGKGWDWEVDSENGNYDYLMGADLDFDHPEVQQEMKDWGAWYQQELNLDGYRLDAVKHIKYQYLQDWTNYQRQKAGKDLFTVGEYWSPDYGKLDNFQNKTGNVMSLFDAPLHYRFHAASTSNGGYDLRTLQDNTLMKYNPTKAVTLVDNHDTQTGQALQSEVLDWFKPHAYNYILLHQSGYPTVFYKDYYNTTFGPMIQKLIQARKLYAYGKERTYGSATANADTGDLIGWTREGDSAHPNSGLASLISDKGSDVQTKWMEVGKQHAGETWYDYTGNIEGTVTINADGWGQFRVNGSSQSVWVKGVVSEPEFDGVTDEVITVNTPFNLRKGVSARDEFDGNLTESIQIYHDGDMLDTSKPGLHFIVYEVENLNYRIGAKGRYISVLPADDTPAIQIEPVVKVVKHPFAYSGELEFVHSAMDRKDGDLRSSVEVVESNVDFNEVGTYATTFRVTNSLGKSAEVTVQFVVTETFEYDGPVVMPWEPKNR